MMLQILKTVSILALPCYLYTVFYVIDNVLCKCAYFSWCLTALSFFIANFILLIVLIV